MDPSTVNVLVSAGSPVALLIVGFWLKRMNDERAERILTLTQASKIVAERAAEVAEQTLAKSAIIERKVDGTLSKAVEDLALARSEITQLSVAWTQFQAKADRYLQTGTGGDALAHVIAQPAPNLIGPLTEEPVKP